ncbi:hypothetical protein LTR37_014153 [Vermiconidia calcicola]|uniref:Uncharacterized protein n=1 Tax=Vermiconidia calcicola TaxID=1690605 RepID=A0ACC3MUB4_9PEZI|nr:hypothetical protein LTR37_014153 [Vermiconidia calcicola]
MIVLLRKEGSSMDLNTELRNRIWEFLLIQNTSTTRVCPVAYRYSAPTEITTRRRRFCANVLSTCKQIQTEGTPILYGENIFAAHPSLLAALPSFLLYATPEKVRLPPVTCSRVAKLIRCYYIHVRLDTDPQFSKMQVEESFSGAKELEINVFQSMYGSCDFSVLKLFEGIRGVGKVSIQGSLGDGKYADWLANTMQLPCGTFVAPYFERYVGGMPFWDAW